MENQDYLNAYRITNTGNIQWSVRKYTITKVQNSPSSHEERGAIKDIIWKLRQQYKERCRGYGFVVDLDEESVAVSSDWDIPEQQDFEGYRVAAGPVFVTNFNNAAHEALIKGILREGIKSQFKSGFSEQLGQLWQDFGDFCQMPGGVPDNNTFLCRKFFVSPELLAEGCWCLKFEVGTRYIDSRTLEDYYRLGNVKELAEYIQLKRMNRLTRDNELISIRVWHAKEFGAEVLELENPEEIFQHEALDQETQKNHVGQTIRCKIYKKPSLDIPLRDLRMILDTQVIQEDHSDSIIDPSERGNWYSLLRDYINGMEILTQVVELDTLPIPSDCFDTVQILPPAIRIKVSKEQEGIIPALQNASPRALKERVRSRENYVRKYGYLEQRPINPLLVVPKNYKRNSAQRLRHDLNRILEQQGLDFQFGEPLFYHSVYDIEKAFEKEQYDSLFAVLPESSRTGETDNDTHEKIKRQIEFPSQCIHIDNTLLPFWVEKPLKELQKGDPRYARRIESHYQQCLLNLVVKHHWVPFAPADPFTYNVHVGIDVGGKHNNRVMSCIGYGFQHPTKELVFLPKEIEIDTQKAEPIPTTYLYQGLQNIFDELYERLCQAGQSPNFNKVLFFRDGELRGKGDAWNEKDALFELFETYKKKRLIQEDAMWTVAEVSKRAGDWRLLYSDGNIIDNPLVGKCVFPFNNRNAAIVCTTGTPYLSQGTASPLLVKVSNISGEAIREDVLRDLIWEADMGFTKLDMGLSLPWVLHVADSGALQQSRSYNITGITV